MRYHRRPVFGGDRAGQIACPALSGGNLHFPAAHIADNGNGAAGPATPHPAQRCTYRLRVLGACQNDQSDLAGGQIEQNILGPAIGDHTTAIHLQKLLTHLRCFRSVTAGHHDTQSLSVPRAFPLKTRSRHSAPSLAGLVVQGLCQRRMSPLLKELSLYGENSYVKADLPAPPPEPICRRQRGRNLQQRLFHPEARRRALRRRRTDTREKNREDTPDSGRATCRGNSGRALATARTTPGKSPQDSSSLRP